MAQELFLKKDPKMDLTTAIKMSTLNPPNGSDPFVEIIQLIQVNVTLFVTHVTHRRPGVGDCG